MTLEEGKKRALKGYFRKENNHTQNPEEQQTHRHTQAGRAGLTQCFK